MAKGYLLQFLFTVQVYCYFCQWLLYYDNFQATFQDIVLSELFTISPAAILEHWHPFVLHHWL